MLKNLTYKRKCLTLFIGMILFFFIGYKLSFSDTLDLIDQISEKQTKLEWFMQKEKELPVLKATLAELERVYSKNDSIAIRDKLTAYISSFADDHGCLVTDIPINSIFSNKDLTVQTNAFTIKGEFKELLKLLNGLERDFRYVAKIMSGRFYSTKDNSTRRVELFLTVITQSFEQK